MSVSLQILKQRNFVIFVASLAFCLLVTGSASQMVSAQGKGPAGSGTYDTTYTQPSPVAPPDAQTQGAEPAENGESEASKNEGRVDAKGDSTDININAADLLSDDSPKSEEADKQTSDSWIAWTIIAVLVSGSLAYINRAKLATFYENIRSRSSK